MRKLIALAVLALALGGVVLVSLETPIPALACDNGGC